MGAWGEGIFENDAAGDWLDRLVSSGKTSVIDKALSLAIKARPGRLEADEASETLAAVEVIAAARGYRHSDLPVEVKEWLVKSGYSPTTDTTALAVQATERVRDDSELRDLWAEGDGLAAWKRGISNVLGRLAKSARPTVPRKAASASPKVSPRPSPRIAVASLRKNRLFFVTRKGSPSPFWCKGSGDRTDKHPLRDADMEHFRHLDGIEELSLSRFRITDEGLRSLSGLTRLRELELKEMPVTDASAPVFEGMLAMTSLDLSGTAIGDAVLEKVGRMTKLQTLRLNKTLPLSRTPGFGIAVTDAGLKHLVACRSLEMIGLEGTRITDAGLQWLGRIPSLQRISLSGTPVTGRGLSHLKALRQITMLTLAKTPLDDAACEVLAGLKNLEWLNLEGTQVTAAGVRKLQRLRNLESLNLSKTSLTDADIPLLLEFPERTALSVLKTKITAKGKKRIRETGRDGIRT